MPWAIIGSLTTSALLTLLGVPSLDRLLTPEAATAALADPWSSATGTPSAPALGSA